MGLFEDTFVTLKSAANVAVEKTGKIIDASKLKISLSEQNSKLTKCFEDLGRLTYTSTKNFNAVDDQRDSIIKNIDTIYDKIKEINDQIALTKDKEVCEKCGYINDKDMIYCGKCGSLLKKEHEEIPIDETEV